MEVAIIYESLTGTTRAAALAMADELYSHRVPCRTFPIQGVDAAAVAAADVVVVGSWTDGALVVGQRPGRARRLRELLPPLVGKRCAVYCTYAITPGKTLAKLEHLVTDAGGEVLGGLAIRRTEVRSGARTLVDGILDAAVV